MALKRGLARAVELDTLGEDGSTRDLQIQRTDNRTESSTPLADWGDDEDPDDRAG